jgi:hypothetical protein
MRKIAILVAVLFLAKAGFSQHDDSKKFRFGLKATPAVNWLTPDNVKKFTKGGSTIGFGFGLVGEYNISENFSITSGIELSFESGKIEYKDNAHYWMTESFEFIEPEKNGAGTYTISDSTQGYRLNVTKRKIKSTYVIIPIGIKMKTKQIGYVTYFGEFGLNLGFRSGSKINDDAIVKDNNPTASNATQELLKNPEDVNLNNEMQPLRVQLKIGLGGEYEIAKGTAVFAGLHYNLGFTNVVKGDSRHLLNDANQRISQKFTAHGITLSVGVLF